jgi:hypothetical protein
MAQICTGYYNGRVRYLFLADFHGLFSRGLTLIIVYRGFARILLFHRVSQSCIVFFNGTQVRLIWQICAEFFFSQSDTVFYTELLCVTLFAPIGEVPGFKSQGKSKKSQV